MNINRMAGDHSNKRILARLVILAICAAVLVSIAALIVKQWQADDVADKVAKFVILMLWLWASCRMINRVFK